MKRMFEREKSGEVGWDLVMFLTKASKISQRKA